MTAWLIILSWLLKNGDRGGTIKLQRMSERLLLSLSSWSLQQLVSVLISFGSDWIMLIQSGPQPPPSPHSRVFLHYLLNVYACVWGVNGELVWRPYHCMRMTTAVRRKEICTQVRLIFFFIHFCTGERPFSCPHCNRAFADRSNLRAHLQTHAEVKKYQCGVCSRTFSRMSLLQKHSSSGCCSTSVWDPTSEEEEET